MDTNITGFTTFLNTNTIKHNVNYRDVEQKIMKGDSKVANPTIKTDETDKEIHTLIESLGIDGDARSYHSRSSKSSHSSGSSTSSGSTRDDYSESEYSSKSSGSSRSSRSSRSHHSHRSDRSKRSSRSGHSDHHHDRGDHGKHRDRDDRHHSHGGGEEKHNKYHHKIQPQSYKDESYESEEDLSKLTYAETQYRKSKAINDIKSLIGLLDAEGYDLSEVVVPAPTDDLKNIEEVRRRLELMKNSNQYTNFAEEIMIGGAKVIEYVFDGTNKIPGTQFAPDYTNYPSSLALKLRGMRYETSKIVGNIFEKNELGPVTQLMIGLLPNFILYPNVNNSKMHKNTISKAGESASRARTEINTADARRDFNTKSSRLDML